MLQILIKEKSQLRQELIKYLKNCTDIKNEEIQEIPSNEVSDIKERVSRLLDESRRELTQLRKTEHLMKLYKKMVYPAANQLAPSKLQFGDSETVVGIKQFFNNYLQVLEKSVNEELDYNFNIHSGELGKKIEQFLGNLSELQTESKNKTDVLSIRPQDRTDFSQIMKQEISNYYQLLLKKIDLAFEFLEQELNSQLLNLNSENKSLLIDHNIDFNASAYITNVVKMDRPFEAVIPRKNWLDHIMGARKYQMLFIMIISTFGLSFLRQMKWFMVPTSFILIGFGIRSIIKNSKNETAEAKEREVIKAKELMKEEAKRIISDFNSKMKRVIGDHIRVQNSIISKSLDGSIGNSYQSMADQIDREKKQAITIQQKVESEEKAIQTLITKLETWQKNIELNLKKVSVEQEFSSN